MLLLVVWLFILITQDKIQRTACFCLLFVGLFFICRTKYIELYVFCCYLVVCSLYVGQNTENCTLQFAVCWFILYMQDKIHRTVWFCFLFGCLFFICRTKYIELHAFVCCSLVYSLQVRQNITGRLGATNQLTAFRFCSHKTE